LRNKEEMLAINTKTSFALFQNIVDHISELEKKLNSFNLSELSQFVRSKFGIQINVFSIQLHEIIESKFSFFLVNNQEITTDCSVQENKIKVISKLYVKMVLYYNLQITKVVSLLWTMIGVMNSGKLVESKPNTNSSDTSPILFTSTHTVTYFLKYCLNALAVPVLRQLGATMLHELTQSAFIQNNLPHLIETLTSLTAQQIDDDDSGMHSVTSSMHSGIKSHQLTSFKLTEHYLCGFNEETDSRNEYKSNQVSGVYCVFVVGYVCF
jgi:hypothetical protein